MNEIAVLNINYLLGENMKKIILGVALAFAVSTAFAAPFNANNPSGDITVNGTQGSIQISQCASVAGNCNNPELNVNFTGNVDTVVVDGVVQTIKGADGKDGVDGKDGIDGKDGATGATGEKGDKGDTGATGAAGKDGVDGKDGKDADVSTLVTKTDYAADKSVQAGIDSAQNAAIDSKVSNDDFAADQKRQDDNLNNLRDGVEQWNQWAAQDSTDQWSAINKETDDRKAGDTALNNKIDQNKANQSVKDASQDAAINGKVDKSQYNQDKFAQGIHDTLQDAAIIGLDVTKADKSDLNKETADRKAADSALNGKIDQAVTNQAATDKAQNTAIGNAQSSANNAQNTANVALGVGIANSIGLAAESSQREAADAALNNKIDKNKADQKVTDDAQNAVISTKVSKAEFSIDQKRQDDALSAESNARIDGDSALNAKIDSNKAAQKVTDDAQDAVINTKASKTDLNTEVAERKTADMKLQNNINHEANTRAQADKVLSSRIDNNDSTLVQHDQRITSNTQRVGAVENRVSNLEQSTNKRFSDMDKRIGDNRKVASAGIAGAGAMANIPQVSQGSTFSVGAGVGGYDSEQAVAVGFSARINNNVVTKMSVSTNTQSELLWGAGVGVEW
ncbi:hypothetical protein DQT32_03760 [Salmonella enterica subsp. enterica serovar Braenderup]|nr:hypothetical protein [Salmonella enterica subsp. enterica serovar Braenderup]